MKNTRLLILPLISLFLLLISFAFLSYWGYRIFYSKPGTKTGTIHKDSSSTSNITRDSLRKVYSATLNSINGPVDLPVRIADSVNGDIKIKPEDFYRLRSEITELLKNPASNADLEIARQKIVELQQKIQDLNNRYTNIELENKRLSAALNQVLKNKPGVLYPKYSPPVRTLNSKKSVAASISISDMNLAAINVGENREVETTLAEQTEKFIGYFTLKHGPNISSSEIYIVVTQPDGHVIQSSPWEAGSFETVLGRKSYSCKLNFDGSRNESTRMQFSINGEGFEKGNYNIQVYHDGAVVKKWVKTLF